MDFRLSDDQRLLLDTARDLFAHEVPPALLRAVTDDPTASKPLWEHIRSFSALGGGAASDLALVLEEAGYVAAPGAFFPTAGLFAPLLTAAGHPDADAALDGAISGTVAVADAHGRWSPHAEPVKCFVIDAGIVDSVAVVTATGDGAVIRVSAVDTLAPREVTTIDATRRIFEIDTSSVEATPVAISDASYTAWLDGAHLALAAEMVGTARRCFDMALDYAKHREQFDRPIGSFQAIQHKLAEMSLEIERSTAAVQYASMVIDADAPDRTRACHVAKAAAGAAARRCLKDAIQIHGGIGYTWEHDLHLYLRRATASEYLLGTTGWHHDRIADIIFSA